MLDRLNGQSDPADGKGANIMTKNTSLVLTASSLVLCGLASLQGCDVGETSAGPAAGAPAAGAPAAGAPAAGAAGARAGAGGASAGSGGSTGGAGGSTAGAGGASAGSAGTTGGASSGGASGAGGGASAACTTFCMDEETTCSFGAATAAPYTGAPACLSACAGFAPGVTGEQANDTFACRRYHLTAAGMGADAAAMAANKTLHCPHTGLISKGAYTDTTATGPCKN
ncbi:MAG: hypothetical protein WDO69_10935 [Pseudomonadota bacterium]